MGKRITTKIDVRMPDVPEEVDIYDFGDEDADQSGSQSGQEYDFDFGDEDSKTGTPPPAHTVMNNPLFISQTGANSNVIPNYGTMNLTLGKHGGGSNE